MNRRHSNSIPKRQADADPGYRDAIGRLMKRIESLLDGVPRERLPMHVVIAGGAALFLHTGTRVSQDVDASFSLRLHIPDDLVETYRDRNGDPRSVHLDTNYNDTLGPMHEAAYDDATPVILRGVDRRVLDIRVLAPIDLATSKLGRFSDHDRADIVDLAANGLLDPVPFEARATEALDYYVGHPSAVRANLKDAVKLIREHLPDAVETKPPRRH